MIVRIQNSTPQVKVTSSTIYNCKFLVQHPKDQSVDQRNHHPGQYIYIALVPSRAIYIALVAGKYKKYCPAMAFDLPTQSGTLYYKKL